MVSSKVIARTLQGETMEKCNECSREVATLTLEWNADTGWRGVCRACRLVPTASAPGQFTFIRIGE